MAVVGWLVAHHVLSVIVALVTAGLSASVLGQRRPTGSAYAWLLVLLFVPYLGIPLYVVFGGRKFRARAEAKAPLPVALTGSPAAHEYAGPATTAASVTWLDDGVLAFETFLREIRGAEASIHIVTFVVADDPTGCALLEALAERAAAGVQVCLLLDDFLRIQAPRRLLRKLEASGGQVRRFMPLVHMPFRGRGNLRNHRKIALFDGARAIVGGMNLAGDYMGPAPDPERWRDLSTVVTGDVVHLLGAIFEEDWGFAGPATPKRALAAAASTAPPAPPPVAIPVRVVPSGPDSPNDAIYDAFLTAIFRAERRIWVSTPYFIPDEPLMRALTVAAHRGVDVRVVVPARSNHPLADLVGAPSLRDLAAEGVRICRHRTMLHAKALLVDGALAVVGSANFDMRSLFLDYEIALFFTGRDEVDRLARWFDDTVGASFDGPPVSGWARTRVEAVARLLAPLL